MATTTNPELDNEALRQQMRGSLPSQQMQQAQTMGPESIGAGALTQQPVDSRGLVPGYQAEPASHPTFSDPGFQNVINAVGSAHPQWAEYQAWQSGGSAPAPTAPTAPAPAPAPHPTFSDPGFQSVINQIGAAHPQWAEYQAWQQSSGQVPVDSRGIVPGYQADPNTPVAGGQTAIQQQADAAQTYSQTPGAAPTQTTTNQGTQDVVRNSYLEQATQGTQIDTNDPNFRQQADTFAAAQERARRAQTSELAEQMSTQGIGGDVNSSIEGRMANERAARNTGAFEADLVGRELQNRRAEIQNALSQLGGLISGDQARQLQAQLAEIDRQLQQQSIDLQGSLGHADLGLRRDIGMGGLNIDMLRTLLADRQHADRLGFDVADREAFYNSLAAQQLLR